MANIILGELATKPEHLDRIEQEIKAALETLRKSDVTCTFVESPGTGGEICLNFALGTTSQTIKIGHYEWTKPVVVNTRIVKHLEL
jgi:hypothetical protein